MSSTNMKTGVMICGHGSRSQSAVDEFATLADKLPATCPMVGTWNMAISNSQTR